MNFDTPALRAKVSIVELMQADGCDLKRRAGRWQCRCPFHDERTASCSVDDEKGFFKCFGCGATGDVFAYYAKSRGLDIETDFRRVCEELSAIAGGDFRSETLIPNKRAEIVDEIPSPLSGRELERWMEGVLYLQANAEEQAKIAAWRGYDPAAVRAFAKAALLGMPLHFGERLPAFPVEAVGTDGAPFQAGFHVRLNPATSRSKAPWNFQPSGIGSWPFVVGNPCAARAILILEGQWDALAAVDALGLGADGGGDGQTAVFGVRGATSWRKVLAWRWPAEAQIFLFADNDEAGQAWFEPEGFAMELRARCRALHAFTIEGVKDFNDAHRAVADRRAEWKAFLREVLRNYWANGLRSRKKRKKS